VREASIRYVQWVEESEGLDLVERSAPSGAKSQELDILERSAPSGTEKEIANGVGARNVGTPATRVSFTPPLEKKTLDHGGALALTGTLSGSRSGLAPLRRGQWERLESRHARKTES
jgi:hypothetical protein